MFREKKTLSLGAKDTKKERTLLRALVFESRGRKERQSRFHRAHTWSSTTRPRPTSRDSVVSIIPVVCFRRIIFCTCVHVCCASKRDVFLSIFRQKNRQKFIMRREEKRTKFSSTESSQKQQKAKRCLSSLLTPVTKTACALDKAFAATIEGSSLGESHRSAHIHHVHHSHHRRRENSNFGTMFFESPGMPRINLANDFGDDFAEMRGTKRSWEEEDLHTPAPRQTTTANNATTTTSCFFPPPHSTSGDTKERIKNFRNDDDIDDFDDCFSIGVRMQRMEEYVSGRATQSVTSIPSEVDASQGGIPMIDSNAVKKLLLEDENGVVLIDCRYFYEYRNGRISSSHNVVFPDDCQRGFIIARDKLLNCANHRNSEKRDLVYVFYDDGEANAMAMHHRATQLFRHIRNLDRLDNMRTYPNLCFPNMFVLKGGFKAFIESSRDREWEDDHRIFYEGSFVSMDDWRFSNETKELHNQVVKRWILAAAAQSLNDFPTRV